MTCVKHACLTPLRCLTCETDLPDGYSADHRPLHDDPSFCAAFVQQCIYWALGVICLDCSGHPEASFMSPSLFYYHRYVVDVALSIKNQRLGILLDGPQGFAANPPYGPLGATAAQWRGLQARGWKVSWHRECDMFVTQHYCHDAVMLILHCLSTWCALVHLVWCDDLTLLFLLVVTVSCSLSSDGIAVVVCQCDMAVPFCVPQ